MIGNDSVRPAAAARPGLAARQREWSKKLLGWTLGWLAFETLTGLSIYLLPFSVPNQWIVIVHTLVGMVFLVPALAYQVRHLKVHWNRPLNAIKLMGYLGSLATVVVLISGLVLTWEALLGPRISYLWDQIHILSTFALVAFVLPHVLVILFRDRSLPGSALGASQRLTLVRTTAVALGCTALVAALWASYPGESWNNRFPADYSYSLGKDRPFAPSLARTASGGAYDARSLSGSESCGTAGCHEEITAQWRVSAHRWAAMDAGFQRIQEEMARQNGAESTRYCGGCHDPISLFSGTKNLFTPKLTGLSGYQEGVSCLACHSVRKTDVAGNANYIVAQPTRYLFELRDGTTARAARDFLIRAYPRRHVEDLSKRVFKTPEYCAACHKQFIDQEVNNVGWVQLQNQYDNWRKSRWNHPGDPRKTIECRECHMPLVPSRDPAAGDGSDYNRSASDGRVRSHRFLGANQFMPTVLKLPGAAEQVALTEQWLRGQIEVPEIADKWRKGPAVALELDLPESAAAGSLVSLRAVVTSNKVGHDFPTGPLDIIQSWIELNVTDDAGRPVYATGGVNEKRFIQPGSFIFKAEPVDQYGNLIDRHNLWEMVGVRFRRSLFPGFSDVAEFSFRCPGASGGGKTASEDAYSFKVPGDGRSLHVSARLLYRKIDQYLLNFMFGENAGLTAPITSLASAEGVIRVLPAGRPAGSTPVRVGEAAAPKAGPPLGSAP
ncbi:MAG TPA: multiheme c-type cytochrome [Candidatus Polarisedimenticolia bacterium]|nr:multiheme c-type cytochrome [Candidatus Polarisedimenticolia bacterium]